MTELDAGRDLDALIAARVFGYTVAIVTRPVYYAGRYTHGDDVAVPGGSLGRLPRYSTDIADAWDIVEHMLGADDEAQCRRFTDAWATMGCVAPGPLAAERICRAALGATDA